MAQKLEEISVILRSSTDKGHGIAIRSANFHILATVVESGSVVVGHKLV